jgi:hypothetical protein
LSNAATNEKDSEMRPGSPEEAKWTDHNWQEQQAMKSNPNGEDQILGHPTYTLEFKNYLRAHDQFSLNKIQELERIAAVTHTHLGWFHHDEHGVKHLHRQWILILARNLEMLPSAPLDVRNAYWIQKADAFEPIYNFWMQHLGLDPNKRLKGQEVPNPAHPPVDDKGKPLEEMPYSDNEISDKENSPRSMSPSFTRRTTRSRNVQTNIPTIKAPKAFTDKKTLPRPQAANNTDTSVPRFAGRGKSNKRLRSENVDASDAGKRAPKRLRGRPRKGVAPGQASAE